MAMVDDFSNRLYLPASEIDIESILLQARQLIFQGQILEAYKLFNEYIKNTLPADEQCRYWDGSDLRGRSLYIFDEWLFIDRTFGNHPEMIGLGDYLQYSRYFPFLANLDCQVTIKCNQALHRLFSYNFPNLTFTSDQPTYYDYLFFGCSLPAVFSSISSKPYLKTSQQIYLPKTDKLRIGICWAASVKMRSISLKAFEPILKVSNCEFWAIQKGDALAELAEYSHRLNHIELQDFDRTAAVVNELDLIISVDTSVAHLAGAMGKPVWVLLPLDADARWGYKKTQNDWYSTMLMFRQFQKDDWATPIRQVSLALKQLV
jgi:hypothetical protein